MVGHDYRWKMDARMFFASICCDPPPDARIAESGPIWLVKASAETALSAPADVCGFSKKQGARCQGTAIRESVSPAFNRGLLNV
jgi:hypothetical protein